MSDIGALANIDKERVVGLFHGISEGTVYDLGQEIQTGAPRLDPFMVPYTISMFTSVDGTRRLLREHMGATNEPGALLESIHMTMHTGTHIDALGHFTIAAELYGGRDAASIVGDWGLTELGIEQCPPILARGVLLDVAAGRGVERMDAGDVIGSADLEAAAAAGGVLVERGDVVLINTGWGALYMTDNATYTAGEPGLGEEAAEWLTQRDIAVVGADNMAVEVLPGEDPQRVFPVHQHFLVRSGVHIIENLRLTELCASGMHEFLFIALPVKYTGATASTLRPIAIV
jgi:kynurenine formamidase